MKFNFFLIFLIIKSLLLSHGTFAQGIVTQSIIGEQVIDRLVEDGKLGVLNNSTIDLFMRSCSLAEMPARGEELAVICESVLQTDICKDVKEDDRLRCDDVEDSTDINAYEFLSGCAGGIFESTKELIGFAWDVMKWVWNSATSPLKTHATAAKYADQSRLYLAREYDEAYENATGWTRSFHAAMAVMGKIFGLIYENIEELISNSRLEFGCLNYQARSKAICKIAGEFIIPPAAAFGLLKYGRRMATGIYKYVHSDRIRKAAKRVASEKANISKDKIKEIDVFDEKVLEKVGRFRRVENLSKGILGVDELTLQQELALRFARRIGWRARVSDVDIGRKLIAGGEPFRQKKQIQVLLKGGFSEAQAKKLLDQGILHASRKEIKQLQKAIDSPDTQLLKRSDDLGDAGDNKFLSAFNDQKFDGVDQYVMYKNGEADELMKVIGYDRNRVLLKDKNGMPRIVVNTGREGGVSSLRSINDSDAIVQEGIKELAGGFLKGGKVTEAALDKILEIRNTYGKSAFQNKEELEKIAKLWGYKPTFYKLADNGVFTASPRELLELAYLGDDAKKFKLKIGNNREKEAFRRAYNEGKLGSKNWNVEYSNQGEKIVGAIESFDDGRVVITQTRGKNRGRKHLVTGSDLYKVAVKSSARKDIMARVDNIKNMDLESRAKRGALYAQHILDRTLNENQVKALVGVTGSKMRNGTALSEVIWKEWEKLDIADWEIKRLLKEGFYFIDGRLDGLPSMDMLTNRIPRAELVIGSAIDTRQKIAALGELAKKYTIKDLNANNIRKHHKKVLADGPAIKERLRSMGFSREEANKIFSDPVILYGAKTKTPAKLPTRNLTKDLDKKNFRESFNEALYAADRKRQIRGDNRYISFGDPNNPTLGKVKGVAFDGALVEDLAGNAHKLHARHGQANDFGSIYRARVSKKSKQAFEESAAKSKAANKSKAKESIKSNEHKGIYGREYTFGEKQVLREAIRLKKNLGKRGWSKQTVRTKQEELFRDANFSEWDIQRLLDNYKLDDFQISELKLPGSPHPAIDELRVGLNRHIDEKALKKPGAKIKKVFDEEINSPLGKFSEVRGSMDNIEFKLKSPWGDEWINRDKLLRKIEEFEGDNVKLVKRDGDVKVDISKSGSKKRPKSSDKPDADGGKNKRNKEAEGGGVADDLLDRYSNEQLMVLERARKIGKTFGKLTGGSKAPWLRRYIKRVQCGALKKKGFSANDMVNLCTFNDLGYYSFTKLKIPQTANKNVDGFVNKLNDVMDKNKDYLINDRYVEVDLKNKIKTPVGDFTGMRGSLNNLEFRMDGKWGSGWVGRDRLVKQIDDYTRKLPADKPKKGSNPKSRRRGPPNDDPAFRDKVADKIENLRKNSLELIDQGALKIDKEYLNWLLEKVKSDSYNISIRGEGADRARKEILEKFEDFKGNLAEVIEKGKERIAKKVNTEKIQESIIEEISDQERAVVMAARIQGRGEDSLKLQREILEKADIGEDEIAHLLEEGGLDLFRIEQMRLGEFRHPKINELAEDINQYIGDESFINKGRFNLFFRNQEDFIDSPFGKIAAIRATPEKGLELRVKGMVFSKWMDEAELFRRIEKFERVHATFNFPNFATDEMNFLKNRLTDHVGNKSGRRALKFEEKFVRGEYISSPIGTIKGMRSTPKAGVEVRLWHWWKHPFGKWVKRKDLVDKMKKFDDAKSAKRGGGGLFAEDHNEVFNSNRKIRWDELVADLTPAQEEVLRAAANVKGSTYANRVEKQRQIIRDGGLTEGELHQLVYNKKLLNAQISESRLPKFENSHMNKMRDFINKHIDETEVNTKGEVKISFKDKKRHKSPIGNVSSIRADHEGLHVWLRTNYGPRRLDRDGLIEKMKKYQDESAPVKLTKSKYRDPEMQNMVTQINQKIDERMAKGKISKKGEVKVNLLFERGIDTPFGKITKIHTTPKKLRLKIRPPGKIFGRWVETDTGGTNLMGKIKEKFIGRKIAESDFLYRMKDFDDVNSPLALKLGAEKIQALREASALKKMTRKRTLDAQEDMLRNAGFTESELGEYMANNAEGLFRFRINQHKIPDFIHAENKEISKQINNLIDMAEFKGSRGRTVLGDDRELITPLGKVMELVVSPEGLKIKIMKPKKGIFSGIKRMRWVNRDEFVRSLNQHQIETPIPGGPPRKLTSRAVYPIKKFFRNRKEKRIARARTPEGRDKLLTKAAKKGGYSQARIAKKQIKKLQKAGLEHSDIVDLVHNHGLIKHQVSKLKLPEYTNDQMKALSGAINSKLTQFTDNFIASPKVNIVFGTRNEIETPLKIGKIVGMRGSRKDIQFRVEGRFWDKWVRREELMKMIEEFEKANGVEYPKKAGMISKVGNMFTRKKKPEVVLEEIAKNDTNKLDGVYRESADAFKKQEPKPNNKKPQGDDKSGRPSKKNQDKPQEKTPEKKSGYSAEERYVLDEALDIASQRGSQTVADQQKALFKGAEFSDRKIRDLFQGQGLLRYKLSKGKLPKFQDEVMNKLRKKINDRIGRTIEELDSYGEAMSYFSKGKEINTPFGKITAIKVHPDSGVILQIGRGGKATFHSTDDFGDHIREYITIMKDRGMPIKFESRIDPIVEKELGPLISL